MVHFTFKDEPVEASIVVGGGEQAKLEIWKDDEGVVHVRIGRVHEKRTQTTKRGWFE